MLTGTSVGAGVGERGVDWAMRDEPILFRYLEVFIWRGCLPREEVSTFLPDGIRPMGIRLAIPVLEGSTGSPSCHCCRRSHCCSAVFCLQWSSVEWICSLASPASRWGLKSLRNSSSNESTYSGCYWLSTNSIRHCPKWLTRNVPFLPLYSVGRYYYFLQFFVGTWRV